MTRLDVRDIPPVNRHPTIHDEFEAEVESFDADNYEVERVAPDEFVATFPKVEA